MGQPARKSELDICGSCGKLYARVYVRLCPECVTSEENRFLLVKHFLADNRGSSIAEIAEATGLARGEVARYYSEGRLVDVDPHFGELASVCTCEPGKPRCHFCRQELAKKFEEHGAGPAKQAPAQPPVRFRGPPPKPGTLGAESPIDPGWKGTSGKTGGTETGPDGRVRYVRRVRRADER